jgi:hypothetical protein
LLGEGNGRVDARDHALRFAAGEFRVQGHQTAQRHRRRPTGRAVVADVEDATHRQTAARYVDNGTAVVVRYPAPDAVQGDHVELGQLVAGGEFGEGLIEQPQVGARRIGQFARVGHLCRVEVDAPELAGAGGSVNVQRQALAKAQLQVAQRLTRAVRLRTRQQREREKPGRQLAVVAVGVVDF